MVLAIGNRLARLCEKNSGAKEKGKLRGLAMSLELAAVCVCIAILVAAAVIVGSSLIKRNKIAATQSELEQLRTAIVQYEAVSTVGKAPTTFDFLKDGYTDINGNTVKDKLPKRWEDNGIVDQWGQSYTITVDSNTTSGTITSPGAPGENNPITINF